MTVERDGTIHYANSAAARLLGYDEQELVGLGVEELVPEQQRHHHEHWRNMFVQSGKARAMGQLNALAARHKSGRSIPVRIELVPLTHTDIAPHTVMAVLYPALESDEMLAQVQRDAGVGTWEWDIEKDHLSWSNSVYEMFGLDRQQFEASYEAYLQVVHPDDRARVAQAIRESQSSTRPYEINYRIVREGEIRHLLERNYLHLDQHGELKYMWGSVIDVTERHLAEAQLQLADAVFKHCAEGILVFDRRQHLLRTNAALLEMAGYSADDVSSMSATELFVDPRDDGPLSLNTLMSSSQLRDDEWRGELRLRHRTGSSIPVLASLSTVDATQDEMRDYILVCTDIREIKSQQEQLRHMAMHDSLTGLPNRRLFSEHLNQAIASSRRAGNRLAVVYIDLDGFKLVNDSYGHEAGDELLRTLAARLKDLVRDCDVLARIGGDEFAFILSNCGDDEMLSEILMRVIQEGATTYRDISVTLSLGAACYPDHGDNGSELLVLADQLMYRSKNNGKNRFMIARNV
ncbi:diguanylate cyclase [Marinobacterium sp. D7]|nr:diguanylate cyclase [Marinobacterium ramblicola]